MLTPVFIRAYLLSTRQFRHFVNRLWRVRLSLSWRQRDALVGLIVSSTDY